MIDSTTSAEAVILNSFLLDWELLLEYLRILIWPTIAMIVLYYFRKNLSGLIDRITNIKGPGGTEVVAEEQKKAQAQENSVKQVPDGETGINEESEIEKIKKNYEDKIKEKGENEHKLKSELIYTQMYLDFERVYRVIFGSQIDLLKRLRLNSAGELTMDTIMFFVLTQRIFLVLKNWLFSQYIGFLTSNQLIYLQNEHYFITDRGRAFLAYIEFFNFPPKNL